MSTIKSMNLNTPGLQELLERVDRGGGGGVLPSSRLKCICRWIGSHFHDWIDYYGVAFE